MRKLALCLMLAALTFSASTKKSMTAPVHMVMTPSAIQWGDAPPNLPKGAKLAVLEGDPSKLRTSQLPHSIVCFCLFGD